ncbi:hypothetical protein WL29_23020 [Burkholderia ubonensis]|uniref:Uncharacterized protein n=1 Tax=Burkholderia ubonensis TaxID=101571 RepID=A0A106QC35_9BURK|nr:hypothetical protein [Burkholderia ubonensis]KWA84235.1 hypothetical protein WL29_23020 [Burkholderia ubonensis]
MTAGFIYFATSIPGYIKVGRFAAHLTVADKERQYRTVVPGFKIRHAYFVEDAVAEEARVLAHLRLVAGTAVTGAGRENFTIPMEEALKSAGTSPSELENHARAAIYQLKPGQDGLPVSELLAEMNRNLQSDLPQMQVVRRNGEIRRALLSIGIHPHAANPDQGLDVALYGLVVDPKKVLQACPGLKLCSTVLEALTL